MANWVVCLGGSSNFCSLYKRSKENNFKVLLDKNKEAPGREFANEYKSIGYDQIKKLKGFSKK